MPTQIKTPKDAEDFVRGCTLLGTGGGGDPKKGLKLLLEDLEQGLKIKFEDSREIDDNVYTACPFLMGSIAPLTEEIKRKMKFYGLEKKVVDRILAAAVKELEEYTGKKISALVPIELGGQNTPAGVDAAVRLGLTVVDGDYTGRAIPEIEQTTPAISNKPMLPITSVDEWGNKAIIKNAVNYRVAENIGKLISVAAFGLAGQAGFLMPAKDMKEVVLRGTLTQCLELGRTIREAREQGKDPVKAAADYLDGRVLFKGEIFKKEADDKEGYYWGTNYIKGIEDFKGHTFKIWFKNENHVSWFDDEPYVTSPDIIAVVDLKTGEPITNTNTAPGMKVAVIGAKSPEIWRTPKGLEVLSPPHFGFEDIQWKPIEKIVY